MEFGLAIYIMVRKSDLSLQDGDLILPTVFMGDESYQESGMQ